MLDITIPARELWDEKQQMFITTKKQILRLEHSLVSLSKWESKWCKPFRSKDKHTVEETIDYIKCMTLTQNVDSSVYLCFTEREIKIVEQYIDNPMTATKISSTNLSGGSGGVIRETITSELIYYWMVSLNIPFECQKWHLNRLITLIKVCNIKNQPPKKRSAKEIMSRNAALNAARREQLKSKG